jgi:ELWxxDGT repeat protein
VIGELDDLTGTPQRLGDAFYFLALGQGRGLELWRSDGTVAGTGIAIERCPGPCSGFAGISPTKLAVDRLLLYPSPDPATGVEPLVSDGTEEGTVGLGDVCPGPCSSSITESFRLTNLGGAVIFTSAFGGSQGSTTDLVATDLSEGSAVRFLEFTRAFAPVFSKDTMFFLGIEGGTSQMALGLWKLTLPAFDPTPPPGPWSSDPALPGFEAKVRISFDGTSRPGALEAECIPETLCFSGALPGRTEVFVRVVGPKPNGRLWPTLTKFTTSTVEVWLRQFSTDEMKYYRLEASPAGIDELPGLFDRDGFEP